MNQVSIIKYPNINFQIHNYQILPSLGRWEKKQYSASYQYLININCKINLFPLMKSFIYSFFFYFCVQHVPQIVPNFNWPNDVVQELNIHSFNVHNNILYTFLIFEYCFVVVSVHFICTALLPFISYKNCFNDHLGLVGAEVKTEVPSLTPGELKLW